MLAWVKANCKRLSRLASFVFGKYSFAASTHELPMPWKNWSAERLGIALALLAAFGFSLKAIFVKLAYAAAPVEAITLLALRMALSLPFFLVAGLAAWRSGEPLSRRDWGLLVVLGLLGYD